MTDASLEVKHAAAGGHQADTGAGTGTEALEPCAGGTGHRY